MRIAKYLVGTKDYLLVYGTLDPEGIDSPYFYTDSASRRGNRIPVSTLLFLAR